MTIFKRSFQVVGKRPAFYRLTNLNWQKKSREHEKSQKVVKPSKCWDKASTLLNNELKPKWQVLTWQQRDSKLFLVCYVKN